MGFASISIPQLTIILFIVIMLFGTKRIAQLGGDLGAMIKGFKKEVKDVDSDDVEADLKSLVKDANKVRKTAKMAKKVLGK